MFNNLGLTWDIEYIGVPDTQQVLTIYQFSTLGLVSSAQQHVSNWVQGESQREFSSSTEILRQGWGAQQNPTVTWCLDTKPDWKGESFTPQHFRKPVMN